MADIEWLSIPTLSTLVALGCTTYFVIFLLREPTKLKYKNNDFLIITGCDSGIGLELAEFFARKYEFHIVACLLDLNGSTGHVRLQKLAQEQDNLHLIKVDIRSQEDINELVKYTDIMKGYGKFDKMIGLINNAGILVYGEFDWLTWDQIENQIRINLLGTVAITRSLLHKLVESSGRIVNFSSICDNIVIPGVSVYAATKAALSTFTNVIGYELDKFGVKSIRIKLGDFAKLTNIMARHETNKLEMVREFDERKKTTYEGYFEEFQELVTKEMGFTGVSSYNESTLFRDIERALFLKNPPQSMTIAPLKFKLIYAIIELLPVRWTYFLLRKAIPITLKKPVINYTM